MITSGSINHYINPQWSWVCWTACGLFFLLGGVSGYALIMEWQAGRVVAAIALAEQADHDHEHSHNGPTHTAVSWPVLGVLVVPLVLGMGVPSKALGSSSLSNNTG